MSGGGSGHEPLHGGFVGSGMLDAACPGEVFTSPVPDQMLAATKTSTAEPGVLYIVKNYTGDVLNFDMAAELAEDEGIRIAKVLVNDDVAVTDSLYTAGRRGTGATLFVEKIAGAAAEQRRSPGGGDVARQVNERLPVRGGPQRLLHAGQGQPHFDLPARDRVGRRHPRRAGARAARDADLREIAHFSVNAILDDMPAQPGALLVNGMGGTPLWSCTASTRRCSGSSRTRASPWPAPSSATTSPRSTWPARRSRSCVSRGVDCAVGRACGDPGAAVGALRQPATEGVRPVDVSTVRAWIDASRAAVEEHEDQRPRLDSAIGDADHGSNLRRGFAAVSAAL